MAEIPLWSYNLVVQKLTIQDEKALSISFGADLFHCGPHHFHFYLHNPNMSSEKEKEEKVGEELDILAKLGRSFLILLV
jgi:hypothetical protein